MRIAGAGCAFPKYRYPQAVLAAGLQGYWREKLATPDGLERLHSHCGVEFRYTSVPMEEYPALDTFGKTNNVWIKTALDLGEEAICRAITPSGMEVDEVAALIFTSVTGICSPSIDARLVNRMGLSRNIKRVPIFGLGCVAGAAGIARAADYVRAFPDEVAVLLSVELCSLTWQRNDLSVANLISAGLFGDGAAAVAIAGADTRFAGPEIVATKSTFYPDSEYVMGWDVSETGFRIVLSPDVPKVIVEHLREDVDGFLGERGMTRRDISSYIIHTGGPRVLDAVQEALEIPAKALEASWESLRNVGNLSSASVLLVLHDYLTRRRGEPGSWSLLAAMGPGFCSELVLLRW